MPTMRANKSNKASKNARNRDMKGRLAEQNFRTPLSDALRQKLAEISQPEQKTGTSMIADEIVGKAATKVKKTGMTKALLMVVNTPTIRIEAKSAQRILTDDIATADPEKRHERVKELFTRGLERSAEEFDR